MIITIVFPRGAPKNVREALMKEFGFPRSAFKIIPMGDGYGEHDGLPPDRDRAADRRAEILIFNSKKECLE